MSSAEPGRASWRDVGSITALALLARVVWLRTPGLFPDGDEYLTLANWLRLTHTYTLDGRMPTSYRPPLYPALLAALSTISSDPVSTVLFLQCLLGTLTVTMCFLTARRVFGRRAALVGAIMLALAPVTARFSSVLLTETLFIFLLVSGTSAWMRGRTILTGVCFGAAILTRAILLPFVVALGVAGLVPGLRIDRRACRQIAATALLMIAPWIARNFVQVGRATVADSGWGGTLLVGTVAIHPGSNPWEQIVIDLGPDYDVLGIRSADGERRAMTRALARIRARPLHWIGVRVRQEPRLFIDTGDQLPLAVNERSFGDAWRDGYYDTVLLKAGFAIGNVLVACLAVAGLWLQRRRLGQLLPLWSYPAYLLLAHMPVSVEERFGLPLVPFAMMFAGVALVALFDRVAAGRQAPASQTS